MSQRDHTCEVYSKLSGVKPALVFCLNSVEAFPCTNHLQESCPQTSVVGSSVLEVKQVKEVY